MYFLRKRIGFHGVVLLLLLFLVSLLLFLICSNTESLRHLSNNLCYFSLDDVS